jgi:nitrogen-specific signal transduction histidine kinase
VRDGPGWSHRALGRTLALLFTPEDRAAGVPEEELRIAARQRRSEDERWQLRKDGARLWAIGIVVPVHDEQGSLLGFGKILRERTELFSQGHPALPGSQVGIGIGLALTRDLVALHGGTIQARSPGVGKGSEFTVHLPLVSGALTIEGKQPG